MENKRSVSPTVADSTPPVEQESPVEVFKWEEEPVPVEKEWVTVEGAPGLAPSSAHPVDVSGDKAEGPSSVRNNVIPGVLSDQEIGMFAMFSEMHQEAKRNMPEAPEQVKATMRAAMAKLLAFWTHVQSSVQSSVQSAKSSEISRAVTDPEIGMAGMFKEIGDSLPKSNVNASEYMDALLAKLLETYSKAKHTVGNAASQVPELINPTPTTVIDDDVSLAGMFKEVSRKFPGTTEQQAEGYMVDRLQQISEAAVEKEQSIGGGGSSTQPSATS